MCVYVYVCVRAGMFVDVKGKASDNLLSLVQLFGANTCLICFCITKLIVVKPLLAAYSFIRQREAIELI